VALFIPAGSLARAVTMPDDTKTATLRARLKATVKEAEDAETQTAAAHRSVQDARLLLEEESKATALEQTATAARQRMPSSSSPVAASQLVPPPLRPTKTRSSPDFTFRWLQCSTSASW
jgi:hypothetical protein